MRFISRKKFRRQYKKLPVKIQKKLDERLSLFRENSYDSRLRRHRLKGDMQSFESIDITGDCRVLFIQKGEDVALYAVGIHSELY